LIFVSSWNHYEAIPLQIFEAGLTHIVFAPFPKIPSSFDYVVDSAVGNTEGNVSVISFYTESDRPTATALLRSLESKGDSVDPVLRAAVDKSTVRRFKASSVIRRFGDYFS
jgi:hypothetical protein